MNSSDQEKKVRRAPRPIRVVGLLASLIILTLFGSAYLTPEVPVKDQPIASVSLSKPTALPDSDFVNPWTGPTEQQLAKLDPARQKQIRYGRELIAHTANYLGPKGSVRAISNGMNCQNCHLQAGTQPWGNNYFAVESAYPKFRSRSGTVEGQVKRVNDCLERSLNGKGLDSTSREMQAILAYFKWLGTEVPKKTVPRGTGLYKLKVLNRATDPVRGKEVYVQKCLSCHQADGQGILAADGKSYTYPPLWGQHSYNVGAGLYRISTFAGFVRLNMPFGATYQHPQLTDEEAWDVAAYVNSQPRPTKDLRGDWPDITAKPFDHPFGPYADSFSEQQHKYGPYGPIQAWMAAHKK